MLIIVNNETFKNFFTKLYWLICFKAIGQLFPTAVYT